MVRYVGESFEGSVAIDGNQYDYCNFSRATLIYSGGSPPSLRNCDLSESQLVFEGEAANTMVMLRSMAEPGSGFSKLILKEIAAMLSSHVARPPAPAPADSLDDLAARG